MPEVITNQDFVDKRLFRNQWFSYENELISLTSYKYFLNVHHTMSAKLKLPDIIQSLIITGKYYKEHREEIDGNALEKFRYSMRNNIMEVLRESVSILHRHHLFVNSRIQTLIGDQFSKMKKHYIEMASADVAQN